MLKIFPKLSETFIINELAELRRLGVQLRILSLLPPREELRHKLVFDSGLDQLICCEPRQFPTVLREFRPELLHAHFATESAQTARELAEECDIPFTFTSHGYDIFRKPPGDYAARAGAAQAVITVSQANARYISATFGVAPEHIHVIPCGVDLERFSPKHGPENGAEPAVVCVARHVVVKNLPMLLKSCALLKRRGVKFRCVMVGDGPCRTQLEELRKELDLDSLVEMRGAAEQADVLQTWQNAAVGVLTSNSEGMPVSLMEAAACGIPVVATRVGGVSELVEDGTTGLLVEPGNVEGFAAALERLLVHRELRTCMGAAARARAETHFSLQRQVGLLLQLWSGILAKARP